MSFLKRGTICQHGYFDKKTFESYGLMTYWKECLDCGTEFDFRRIPLRKTRHEIRDTSRGKCANGTP